MMHILIVGANQGIGYYMAEELLARGNHVSILDVETGNLAGLQKTYPGRFLSVVCDARDADSVRQGVEKSFTAFGSMDIAVHNACRCTFDSMEETDYGVYEDVFNVNYFGALRLAKSVLPYMVKARAGKGCGDQVKGKIIFTSSGVGVMGFHNISPYASSKGAIESLAKCLNIEYGDKGIRFQLFHPPLTNTKSASPLPVPQEFLADPKAVGCGLARRIHKKGFYICHSAGQQVQTSLCYLFPIKMGKMMSRLFKRAQPS